MLNIEDRLDLIEEALNNLSNDSYLLKLGLKQARDNEKLIFRNISAIERYLKVKSKFIGGVEYLQDIESKKELDK